MSQVWNPLLAAVVAVIAFGFQAGSNAGCNFLRIKARQGEILAITEDSEQHAAHSATMGLHCRENFYDVGHDGMWRIAHSFALVAVCVGGLTCLVTCAAAVFTPSLSLWRGIGMAAALSALLQLPAFVIFESFPCSDFHAQQDCAVSDGSYLLIVSTVGWLSVTTITQFLDPPLWKQQLHLWRIPKGRTVEATSNDYDEEEADRNNDDNSQDPIFASGIQRSDALVEQDRKLVERVMGWVARAPTDDTREKRRVVQKYSYAVPPAVAAAASQMGLRGKQSNSDDANEAAEDRVASSYLYRNTKANRSIVHVEEKRLQQGLKKKKVRVEQPQSPTTGSNTISADESMLDTINGEESLLDASSAEQEKGSVEPEQPVFTEKELAEEGVHGTMVYAELAEKDRILLATTEVADTKPAIVSPLNDQEAADTSPPRETSNPTTPEKLPAGSSKGLFRATIASRVQAYCRMMSDEDSASPMRIPSTRPSPAQEAPPMTEVSFDKSVGVFEVDSPLDRHLLSDWNDLFDSEPIAPSSTSDDDSAIGRQAPVSTSDEGSESDRYFASSEYEEPGESSGHTTSENEDQDDRSAEGNSSERPKKKVLRPPRIRRKRPQDGSVSSSHSLLSCTIEEETEEDLQNAASEDPELERLNSTPKTKSILRRSLSSPDLSRPRSIVAEDVNMIGMNSYHVVEVHRQSLTTGTERPPAISGEPRVSSSEQIANVRSVLESLRKKRSKSLEPRPLKDDESMMNSCVSGQSGLSTGTGPQPIESLATPTPSSSVLPEEPDSPPQKKRSRSLDMPHRTQSLSVWKPERDLRGGIHRSFSYVSSSESSTEDSRGRARVRRARIERLQGQRNSSSNSETSYLSDKYRIDPAAKSQTVAAHTKLPRSSNATLSKAAARRLRVVSPEHSSEASTTTGSNVDAAESYLLDSVDVSLALLARDTDDEYGSEEDSI